MLESKVQLAEKSERVFARLFGIIFDNPLMYLLLLATSLRGISEQPVLSFLFSILSGGLIGIYFYLGRIGTSPVKIFYGLQVVSTETGKPVGFCKMLLRDLTVYTLGWLMLTGAFRHDGWFKTKVVKKTRAEFREQLRAPDLGVNS